MSSSNSNAGTSKNIFKKVEKFQRYKKSANEVQDFQKHQDRSKFQWQEQAKQNYDQQNIYEEEVLESEGLHFACEEKSHSNLQSFKEKVLEVSHAVGQTIKAQAEHIIQTEQKFIKRNEAKKPSSQITGKISQKEQELILQQRIQQSGYIPPSASSNYLMNQGGIIQQEELAGKHLSYNKRTSSDSSSQTPKSEKSNYAQRTNQPVASNTKSSIQQQINSQSRGTKDYSSMSSSSYSSNSQTLGMKKPDKLKQTFFQKHIAQILPKKEEPPNKNGYFSETRSKTSTMVVPTSIKSPLNDAKAKEDDFKKLKTRKSVKINENVEIMKEETYEEQYIEQIKPVKENLILFDDNENDDHFEIEKEDYSNANKKQQPQNMNDPFDFFSDDADLKDALKPSDGAHVFPESKENIQGDQKKSQNNDDLFGSQFQSPGQYGSQDFDRVQYQATSTSTQQYYRQESFSQNTQTFNVAGEGIQDNQRINNNNINNNNNNNSYTNNQYQQFWGQNQQQNNQQYGEQTHYGFLTLQQQQELQRQQQQQQQIALEEKYNYYFFNKELTQPASSPAHFSAGQEGTSQSPITNEIDMVSEDEEKIKINKIIKEKHLSIGDRSRKRTEKEIRRRNKHENEADRKHLDFKKLPENQNIRSMKDIQTGSMRTSYALSKRSFKWSKSILSSGRSSYKSGFTAEEYLSQQLGSDKEQAKGGDFSSYDSIDFEQIGDLAQSDGAAKKSGLISFKITEQKGLKNKLKQKKQQEELQNKDNHEDQENGYKALQSFYQQLQIKNHTDIKSSAETFGEAMTLFIENQSQFSHIITSDSFVYHSNIGEGSFGTVDLYFFKQSNIKDSAEVLHSNQSQDTWYTNTMNSKGSQSQPNQNSIYFSAQSNNPNLLQFSIDTTNQSQQLGSQMETKNSNMTNSANQIPLIATNPSNQQSADSEMGIEKQQSVYLAKQESLSEFQFLPVACKKIENLEEYQRELYIMQTVKCEYMPKLLHLDLNKQLLFMELGLCSLEDLKNDSEENGYLFSDEFTYQILVNLIKAVESLLSNKSEDTKQWQPLFHSDIKPSNVMLTVKKYKNQPHCSIKLLLIDYGGASFALEDYWSFYTPAFVCNSLWEKLCAAQNQETLNWDQIRYAELYAACRSVQFMIVPEKEKDHFKKENYDQFLQCYSHLYPKTCYILRQVYTREYIGSIHNIYDNILSSSEKTLYTGLNPQNIPFESQKIFELSKFYNCLNNDHNNNNNNNNEKKEDSPVELMEKEENQEELNQHQNFMNVPQPAQVY